MAEQLPNVVSDREVYRTFPAERARQAHAAGLLLVLLVDGLDEDTGTHAGPGVASIASLLPKNPPPGLKVIAAGRPSPRLPDDVDPDHPLWTCQRELLTVPPYAAEVGRVANRELRELLADNGLGREVVSLIAAGGGGLTLADLENYPDIPSHEPRFPSSETYSCI